MCICVCHCVAFCIWVQIITKTRREHWISNLELELQLAVSCVMQVLGTKFRASARAVDAPNS